MLNIYKISLFTVCMSLLMSCDGRNPSHKSPIKADMLIYTKKQELCFKPSISKKFIVKDVSFTLQKLPESQQSHSVSYIWTKFYDNSQYLGEEVCTNFSEQLSAPLKVNSEYIIFMNGLVVNKYQQIASGYRFYYNSQRNIQNLVPIL
ncbi:hypothetical protein [Phocoenobacter skyensis]|uniref:Lipoprotein n=1 Tax=Phocoenobacter skyensis TaxID=97481 RepID=A0A1H7VM51_9PAST|nr:hypothetical protein [Pasteurella skyensis]MDP8078826.1 hypothetical protein [Pasteurella skyensis]MDP8084861.1 hypothetical protein [Pasteurella skyensis]MDP8185497.1 hypothetical protein [Pasteurella skyensis]QLB22471.1 hypothetical protein A6B44_04335 [Pasteurella skyensis]SEM09935.1 hypothetical protein SAMN05444853_10516 [Pasteurella skyensis]